MRHPPHRSDPYVFDRYYLDQAGSGNNVFAGSRTQRGHGLGSIFSGLFKAAAPLLKRGAKALGTQALKTGMEIAGDVIDGKNIKTAALSRARNAGSELRNRALDNVREGPPGRRRKSKRNKKRRVDYLDD